MTTLFPTERDRKLRLLIPLIVASGFFLEQVDSTILTTAIPDMARGLNETPLRLNLALTSYILALAVFIPISGWIADRFGMRRTFAIAVAVFTLGSIVCGAAQSFEMLVASRVLQGLGGAMMNPVGRLILLRSFPRRDLVTAMTYVSIPSVMGPVLGPLAGGVITTYASWRWIFFVNVPFGVLFVLLALRFVPEAETEGAPSRFDLPGFLIVGFALALLEFGIENLGHPLLPRWGIGALFAGAAALCMVYVRYARAHDNAVLDLSILRIRSFRVAMASGAISRVGLNGVPFLLPLMLQIGFGFTPIQSGTTTFVSSLGTLVIRPLSAFLLRKFGYDRLLPANAIFAAVVVASFALLTAATPHVILLAVVLIFGIARNTQFNSLQTLNYADVPAAMLSRATSLGSVVQQLSMGFGVSISATMLGMIAGSESHLSVGDFHLVFLGLGLIILAALPGLSLLQPEDGVTVSRHVRGGATAQQRLSENTRT